MVAGADATGKERAGGDRAGTGCTGLCTEARRARPVCAGVGQHRPSVELLGRSCASICSGARAECENAEEGRRMNRDTLEQRAARWNRQRRSNAQLITLAVGLVTAAAIVRTSL